MTKTAFTTADQLAEELLFIGDDGHRFFDNDMITQDFSLEDMQELALTAIKSKMEQEEQNSREGFLSNEKPKYSDSTLHTFINDDKYREAVAAILFTEHSKLRELNQEVDR